MKAILNAFVYTLFVIQVVTIRQRYAVTPLDGAERFYLKVKYSRAPLHPFENETLKMKLKICEDIVTSPLFDTVFRVKPANPMEVELKHLKIKHVFKNFVTFTYNYRRIEVVVDGEIVHEYGFSCFARSLEQKNSEDKMSEFNEYFISAEYHLGEANDYKNWAEKGNIFGRFVFTYNEKKEYIAVALAEEPGQTVGQGTEIPENSNWKEPSTSIDFGEEEMADTICELPLFLKIRLCVLVLGAEEYSDEVKFVPRKGNVDPLCARKDIEFERAENRSAGSHYLQDWMIGCKTIQVERNESLTFYVSRDINTHNYFICRTNGRNDMYVAGVTYRVAVKSFLYKKKNHTMNQIQDGIITSMAHSKS